MYVITHHHDYDEVLLGPIDWNPRFIASVLRDDLDLNQTPTVLLSDEQRVPYDILPNVRVRKVEQVFADINPKIQRHEGPFWSYENDVGIATYTAVAKSIDLVKGELKNAVASERYKREVSGINVTVQGIELFCDTSRENRDVFLQKHLALTSQETVNWKFINTWLTLSKEELIEIHNQITAHVQSCFDWEAEKNIMIDSCVTLEELNTISTAE
jgi:hypothetical protein